MRRTAIHRTLVLVAIAAGVALTSSGCAATSTEEEAPMVTYDEALGELNAILEAVQERIGGAWELGDSGARSYTYGGGDGAQSPAQRFGHGVELADQQILIDEIVSMWTDAGFTPVLRERPPLDGVIVTEVNYPGEGADENGMYLRLGVSTNATVITAQTRCGAGNAAQINDEYWEQRGE